MPLDSKVIGNEAPKNDMIAVGLKTQDRQLDPKQNPMPKKVIETETPKNDMVTVNLNTQDTQLNPKPNLMPKKTLESLKVIVQKWFWRSKTQNKITKQRP